MGIESKKTLNREFIVIGFKNSFASLLIVATGFVASAHATVIQNSAGTTTTWFENFDSGSSFSRGELKRGRIDGQYTGDNYLHTQNGLFTNPTSFSFTFSTLPTQSLVVVDFYYSSLYTHTNDTSQTISLDGNSRSICGATLCTSTGQFLDVNANNPGADSSTNADLADRFASFQWDNLVGGTHTLTFSTGPQSFQGLSIDDVLITASVGKQVSAVPEPSTLFLLTAGLGLMGFGARRRQKTFTA